MASINFHSAYPIDHQGAPFWAIILQRSSASGVWTPQLKERSANDRQMSPMMRQHEQSQVLFDVYVRVIQLKHKHAENLWKAALHHLCKPACPVLIKVLAGPTIVSSPSNKCMLQASGCDGYPERLAG